MVTFWLLLRLMDVHSVPIDILKSYNIPNSTKHIDIFWSVVSKNKYFKIEVQRKTNIPQLQYLDLNKLSNLFLIL